MGSENSTDSVSCASMAYRLRAGLRTIARAVYSAAMRVARRPIPRIETEKKEKFVIATERDSFVWNVTRGRKGSSNEDLPPMFVRVEPDPVIEQSEKQEWPDKPMAKKVYNTPSYSTITPTSSGAVMFEFSSSRFDMDILNLEESDETEVYEAPVFKDFYESEEERQEFESIYEDLTVDAVLEYMDTIDLYHREEAVEEPAEEIAAEPVIEMIEEPAAEVSVTEEAEYTAPVIAGYLAAPVSVISGYLEAPVSCITGYLAAPVVTVDEPAVEECAEESFEEVYEEAEEEMEFFESLYEDLEIFAVLDCIDTIDTEGVDYESLYEDLTVEAVLEYIDTIDIYGFDYESLYEDLTVEAVLDYMDTIDLYHREEAFVPDYVISEIDSPEECETSITIEPRFVPDYVISEIASAEMCETTIEVEQPAAEVPVEMPAEQIDVAAKSIMAQFVFGFDAPVRASPGPTRFRFIAGTEEDDEDDMDEVQVMTYSGDAAVSAKSFSNGPLAL